MAYNIIKGRVEFSNSSTGSIESLVDIWRNQSVGGTKSFTSNITASGYWDSTRNQKLEPLSTLIGADGADRVLTSNGDGTLTAESAVTISTAASVTTISLGGHVTGSTFSGSAHGLTNIILDADHLAATDDSGRTNRLSASFMCLGDGLTGTTELQVTGGTGIIVDGQGVQVLTASNGGLKFTGETLQVDAASTSNKGGGPSDNDEFIIADSSDSDSIKNLTYSQIKTAITDSIASPAITSYTNASNNRIITSVNNSTVNAESDLLFNGLLFQISSSIRVSGAAHVPTFTVLPGGASFGKVGVNVSEPGVQLQVANNTGGAVIGLHRTSSAFYVDGDDIGDLAFVGSAAESVLNISSRIRVEADGSEWNNESYPTRMSFWTTTTGSSSPLQRMVINNSGNVGIGVSVPTNTLEVAGDASITAGITGSGGIHATGSSPHIAIGDEHGQGATAGMLQIRPSDTSNKVLCLMQAKEDEGMRTCFAVTGSGQVLVGGNHFGGIFNVSGSDAETLVSVKSDSMNPALSLTGVGDLFVGRGAYLSGAVQHNYVVKTTSADTYLSGATDRVGIYNLSSPHNAYLPLLSDTLNGLTVTVKCVGSADITVTGSGPSNQLIDQQANKVLSTGDSLTVIGYNGPTGYQWAILNYYDAS